MGEQTGNTDMRRSAAIRASMRSETQSSHRSQEEQMQTTTQAPAEIAEPDDSDMFGRWDRRTPASSSHVQRAKRSAPVVPKNGHWGVLHNEAAPPVASLRGAHEVSAKGMDRMTKGAGVSPSAAKSRPAKK